MGVVVALSNGGRFGEFPGDEIWEGLLGVDLASVDQEMKEDEALVRWLAKQSDALMALLEERAGVAPRRGTKRERAARLVMDEHGRAVVRQAVLCRHLVHRRRHEALERTLAAVARERPQLSGLLSARGDWVRAVMEVALAAPDALPWFPLWDLALRVRFREYRLNETLGLTGAPASEAVTRELVDGVLRQAGDEALRCVDVIPDDGAVMIFLLRQGSRERIATLDGVRYVQRAQWLILRLSEDGERLRLYPSAALGARLGEVIAARAWGKGPLQFEPYRPRAGSEAIASWTENLLNGEREGLVELLELDFAVPGINRVAWRIQGDVAAGLALLARAWEAREPQAIAPELRRAVLGFRPAPKERPGRFTVWVERQEDGASVTVTYRGHGVSSAQEQAFLQWMEGLGIPCAPR